MTLRCPHCDTALTLQAVFADPMERFRRAQEKKDHGVVVSGAAPLVPLVMPRVVEPAPAREKSPQRLERDRRMAALPEGRKRAVTGVEYARRAELRASVAHQWLLAAVNKGTVQREQDVPGGPWLYWRDA